MQRESQEMKLIAAQSATSDCIARIIKEFPEIPVKVLDGMHRRIYEVTCEYFGVQRASISDFEKHRIMS